MVDDDDDGDDKDADKDYDDSEAWAASCVEQLPTDSDEHDDDAEAADEEVNWLSTGSTVFNLLLLPLLFSQNFIFHGHPV